MKRNVIITIIVLVLISLLLHFYMQTDSYRIYMALCEAKENKKGPTLIEIIIDAEDIVLPMVQGGKALDNMILE